MTRLVETAKTSLEPAAAFAHVADFSNIHLWDPGVVDSVQATPEPLGVGKAYDLDLEYGGRALQMRYTVTEYEPDRRIVLEGAGGVVSAVDTITFEPDGDGTVVAYQADLSLTGLARLAQPFMKSRFNAIGKAAGDGLRTWLKQLELQYR